MPDTMVMLQLEHRSYWRILNLLDRLVDQLEAGHSVDSSRIGLIFEYFSEYPDRCHHPKEDLVFRHLELRDGAVASRIGDLLGDHAELAEITRRTTRCVAKAAEGEGMSAPDCIAAMREFSRAYREHIEAEERLFIPQVLETLTRGDLDLIDFSMFDDQDPIFDENGEAKFGRLRLAILTGGEEGRSGST